jgi:hypothetical protein
MTLVLPRLDRTTAQELLEQKLDLPVGELSSSLPDRSPVVTYASVGGQRVEESVLQQLRSDLLAIADEHGLPGAPRDLSTFEGRAARLLRGVLDMTPHEASHEEVWSYLTCCWLLDVAVWRFGADASVDRYLGHINRNTFRRMWWRAEVLGPEVDLTHLGEDELVNIMERPTLFSDRRLAQSIASEFLARVDAGDVGDRMRLMREATKRLLRLTPFLSFASLDQASIRTIVGDAFDAASAGIAGQPAFMPARVSDTLPAASEGIIEREVIATAEPSTPAESAPSGSISLEELGQAALDLARRTGRVTNMTLREVAPITSDEAREVFQLLLDRGDLVRRGVKRGTHYVLPEPPTVPEETPMPGSPRDTQDQAPPPGPLPSETALRRLLRRNR